MVPTGENDSPQDDSDGRIAALRDSKWSRAIPALLLVAVLTVSSLAFPLVASGQVAEDEVIYTASSSITDVEYDADNDAIIYTTSNAVRSVDYETGSLNWERTFSDGIYPRSLRVDGDSVYFSVQFTNNQVYRLEKTGGSTTWAVSQPTSFIAMDSDYLYAESDTDALDQIQKSDGQRIGSISSGTPIYVVSPADCIVYGVDRFDDILRKASCEGGSFTQEWQTSYSGAGIVSAAGEDHVALTHDGGLTGLDSDGNERWTVSFSGYHTSAYGTLYTVDGSDLQIRSYESGGVSSTISYNSSIQEVDEGKNGNLITAHDDNTIRSTSGSITPTPEPTPTATPIPGDERLELNSQTLLPPNGTYPFTLYYWESEAGGVRGERQDVTTDTNTSYTIENVTVNGTQALSLNQSGDQFDTVNDEDAAVTVNVTAEYDSGTEVLNTTETIVVAAPTVENLAILPTGMYRAQAVILDNTMFALIVAALLSVAASRFVNSFAGLATAEMVIVVGWLGGYVGLGIAMLSVFVAIFIGLNVAENLGIQAGGIRR